MANTVTVGTPVGQSPTVYPCTINGTTNVDIVVSSATLQAIPQSEQNNYVEARALLLYGDSAGTTAIVQPLANGDEVNPNWAQQWIDGNIPS